MSPPALLAAAAPATPLFDAGVIAMFTTLGAAVIAGIFSVLLKRARGPADVLAAQKAADEAAAILADKVREREEAKEAGYREAAEFVRQSAESAIETYKVQVKELGAAVTLLTASLSQQERLAEVARGLSIAERESFQRTIDALRERIRGLEAHIRQLGEMTRAQQLKIDVLEGRRPTSSVDLDREFDTIPPSEMDSLRASLIIGTNTKEIPTV